MPSTETRGTQPSVVRHPAGRTRRSREPFRDTALDRAVPVPEPSLRPPARHPKSTTTWADRNRSNAVPLASLSGPQRRIVGALLEAAKAADAKKAGHDSQ
jgi:hypothetical protein